MAGTQIATPHGPKNIEDIQVGDSVYSRSVGGFENSIRTVTQTVNREADIYIFIFTEFGFIKATPSHPFWVQGKGWTDATDIQVDDYIATRQGDAWVNEVDRITNSTQVYNFSVDQDATYFAGPGELWVHNACKTATPDEVRDALGDREEDYYLAQYEDGLRIVRRHASPDTPKLGHRIGEDGKVEIFEITDNIDFAARPIDTQKISVNDIRDPELDLLEKHRERLNMLIDQRYKNGELDKVAELQKKRIAQSEKIGEAVARKHFNKLGTSE